MKNAHILLVDDDSEALLSLSRALKAFIGDVEIFGTSTSAKALELQKANKISCAVVDLELIKGQGPSSGLLLIEALLKHDPDIRILVLTGHSSVEYGIESIKRGAASFLEKPANVELLVALIKDCINSYALRIELRRQIVSKKDLGPMRLAGQSAVTRKLREEIIFAASTNQSIFLSGESGVGKGLCASLIHTMSSRAQKKFIRYQPGFVSGDLVNSDLFGHKKGSFTGADKDREGLLKEVDGGTLFLDEVDALPIETQVIFLGVLQEKTFRPVGGNEDVSCNFRLIAASNAVISQAIDEHKVRKDFYFRIAHHTITIPPLRERLSDIPDLLGCILSAGCEKKEYTIANVSDEAIVKLQHHTWPGNIRELQAVTEAAAYRAQFNSRFQIEPSDIILQNRFDADDESSQSAEGFHAKVTSYKKKLIREALARNGGNQVQAAKELGLDRSSLRRIIADEL